MEYGWSVMKYGGRTAPTTKMMEKRRRVYLRPMAEEMGAEPRAPKNAPA